jgi:GNAT superfamily N-acetyltransferase
VTFNIRRAVLSDAPSLAAIQYRAGQLELSWIQGEIVGDAPDMAGKLEDLVPDIWVAERGGCVLGFVAAKQDCILWLYVDPDHHRNGIGRALFRIARDNCGPDAYLDMLGGNEVALGLYLAEGFGIDGRHVGDVPGFSRPMESLRLSRRAGVTV